MVRCRSPCASHYASTWVLLLRLKSLPAPRSLAACTPRRLSVALKTQWFRVYVLPVLSSNTWALNNCATVQRHRATRQGAQCCSSQPGLTISTGSVGLSWCAYHAAYPFSVGLEGCTSQSPGSQFPLLDSRMGHWDWSVGALSGVSVSFSHALLKRVI